MKENLTMPEVKYRSDNKSQGQKAQPTKLGNELSKTKTTIHPKGTQAHTGVEEMKTPDIWATFPVSRKDRL
jgi:hypothetical protein